MSTCYTVDNFPSTTKMYLFGITAEQIEATKKTATQPVLTGALLVPEFPEAILVQSEPNAAFQTLPGGTPGGLPGVTPGGLTAVVSGLLDCMGHLRCSDCGKLSLGSDVAFNDYHLDQILEANSRGVYRGCYRGHVIVRSDGLVRVRYVVRSGQESKVPAGTIDRYLVLTSADGSVTCVTFSDGEWYICDFCSRVVCSHCNIWNSSIERHILVATEWNHQYDGFNINIPSQFLCVDHIANRYVRALPVSTIFPLVDPTHHGRFIATLNAQRLKWVSDDGQLFFRRCLILRTTLIEIMPNELIGLVIEFDNSVLHDPARKAAFRQLQSDLRSCRYLKY